MEAFACSSPQSSRRVAMLIDGATPGQPSLMRRLRRGGCVVLAARSPGEVEAMCEQGTVDVVVVPLSRSGTACTALLRRLAERFPDVVAVLLSGAPTTHQVAAVLDLGVAGVLTADADRQTVLAVFERAWEERELRRMDRLLRAEAERDRLHRAERARRFDAGLQALGFRWLRVDRLRGPHGESRQLVLQVDGRPGEAVARLWELAEDLGRIDELEQAVRTWLAAELSAHPGWTEVFVDAVSDKLIEGLLAAGRCPLSDHAHRLILDLPRDVDAWEGDDLALAVERLRTHGFRFCTDELGLWGDRASRLRKLRPEFVRLTMDELGVAEDQTARIHYLQTLVLAAQRAGAQVLVTGVAGPNHRRLAALVGCDMVLRAPVDRTVAEREAGDNSTGEIVAAEMSSTRSPVPC